MTIVTRLPFSYFHKAIFAIFLAWLLTVFAGYDFIPFTVDYYNAWRFGQIGLLIIFTIGFLILPLAKFSYFPQFVKITTSIVICYLLLLIVGVKNITSYLTLSLYILLTTATCYFVVLFQSDRQSFEKLLALSVFTPIPSIIYFITSLAIQFIDPVHGEFVSHNTFGNIRYFNDALLPILLILWMRPSFLAESKYNSLVNILGVAYAFIFFNDGARAIMLSLFLAFIAILVFDRHRKQEIIKPLIHFIFAGIIFYVLQHLNVSLDSISIAREGSSGRLSLYLFSIQAFLADPLVGFGAGNFIGSYSLAHPHNLVLLWLSELGAIGVVFTIILSFLLIKLFRDRKKLPVWGWLSIFILISNGMLSGSLVYPISQLLTIVIIAYIVAQLSTQTSIIKPIKNYWIISCKASTLIVISILLVTTYWSYPYIKDDGQDSEGLGINTQLLYRAKGPSTWQNNPILNFPAKNDQ